MKHFGQKFVLAFSLVFTLAAPAVHAAPADDLAFRRDYLLTVIGTYAATPQTATDKAVLESLRTQVKNAASVRALDALARTLKAVRSRDAAREQAKQLMLKELGGFETQTLARATERSITIRKRLETLQKKKHDETAALAVLLDADAQLESVQMSFQNLVTETTETPATILDIPKTRTALATVKTNLKTAYALFEDALRQMK